MKSGEKSMKNLAARRLLTSIKMNPATPKATIAILKVSFEVRGDDVNPFYYLQGLLGLLLHYDGIISILDNLRMSALIMV